MARVCFVAILVVLLPGALALAEPSAADKRRAGELAARSAESYKRGEYQVAVAQLRQAYALYPQPNLLYNLGRSLEKLGDAKGAIDAYEQYLSTADAIPDREAIAKRVAALKAELPAEAVEKPPPPEKQPADEVVHAGGPAQQQQQQPRARSTVAPWLTISAGVVIGGGGGALAAYAIDRHDAALRASTGVAAQRLQQTAQKSALAANVLVPVGAVIAVVGIVWRIHVGRVRATASGVAIAF